MECDQRSLEPNHKCVSTSSFIDTARRADLPAASRSAFGTNTDCVRAAAAAAAEGTHAAGHFLMVPDVEFESDSSARRGRAGRLRDATLASELLTLVPV